MKLKKINLKEIFWDSQIIWWIYLYTFAYIYIKGVITYFGVDGRKLNRLEMKKKCERLKTGINDVYESK